jgi:AAA15 family ATPase/GTPase
MDTIIKDIENLLMISPTSERYSLLGSTYKRKAVLGNATQRKKNLESAAFYYYMAYKKQQTTSPRCITNWYELELLRRMHGKAAWSKKETVTVRKDLFIPPTDQPVVKYELPSLETARKKLEELKKLSSHSFLNADYWQLTDAVDIAICELIPVTKQQQKRLG